MKDNNALKDLHINMTRKLLDDLAITLAKDYEDDSISEGDKVVIQGSLFILQYIKDNLKLSTEKVIFTDAKEGDLKPSLDMEQLMFFYKGISMGCNLFLKKMEQLSKELAMLQKGIALQVMEESRK